MNIREGVKNLGVALHHECHDSLELTQFRLMGAKKKDYIFNWDKITKSEFENEGKRLINFLRNIVNLDLKDDVKIEKNVDCREIRIGSYEIIMVNGNKAILRDRELYNREPSKGELCNKELSKGELYNKENIIFEFTIQKINDTHNVYYKKERDDVELFRRHYHELNCLKNAFLNEISIKEKEKATHQSLQIFCMSIIITLITAGIAGGFEGNEVFIIKYGLLFSVLFSILLFIISLPNYISLNEAKDGMYICTGVDIDRRKKHGKEYRYRDIGERHS